MAQKANIPRLHPEEFDEHFFGNIKPTVRSIYNRFHVEKIEEYTKFMTFPILPHRRSVYYLFYVTEGSAIRSKNLNYHDIRANQLFCLPALQITSLESMSKDVKGYYCHFEPEIFHQSQLNVNIERDFPFFSIMSEPIININAADRISQMFELIYTEYNRNEFDREKILALQLTTLLNEVNFEYTDQPSPSNAAFLITQQYKNELYENIGQIKRVTDCSNKFGISPNHLNKCVKETTGKSAHEILVDMRVLQAKVLLKQTDLQIREIAFKIGEFESSDFSKFFKKSTGQTPLEYRNHVISF